MKRKTIRNLLTAVICVLALLLSACGGAKTEDEATMNEDVQLSNIRFSDMDLTTEEKKMMQDIQELLQSAEVIWASEKYDNDILKVVNEPEAGLRLKKVVSGIELTDEQKQNILCH